MPQYDFDMEKKSLMKQKARREQTCRNPKDTSHQYCGIKSWPYAVNF